MTDTESRKAFEAWCADSGRWYEIPSPSAWAAWKARDAEVAAKDARIAELAERLNIAEAKLTRLGYERECNIPACNCGDGWTHKRAEV